MTGKEDIHVYVKNNPRNVKLLGILVYVPIFILTISIIFITKIMMTVFVRPHHILRVAKQILRMMKMMIVKIMSLSQIQIMNQIIK